jgi:ribosomal-protein-alanine N-acetyltransferase
VLQELYTSFPDDYIMQFLGLTGKEELEKEKNKWRGGLGTYRSTYKRFLLTEKTTGKVIGSGGFHNWFPDHMRAELGYAMTDETAKQKGYMKEAMAAAVKVGFEQMGLNRIEAFVGPENEASQRIVKGLGFTKEGVLREHFCFNGIIGDSICFALLKSEYNKKKGKTKK